MHRFGWLGHLRRRGVGECVGWLATVGPWQHFACSHARRESLKPNHHCLHGDQPETRNPKQNMIPFPTPYELQRLKFRVPSSGPALMILGLGLFLGPSEAFIGSACSIRAPKLSFQVPFRLVCDSDCGSCPNSEPLPSVLCRKLKP